MHACAGLRWRENWSLVKCCLRLGSAACADTDFAASLASASLALLQSAIANHPALVYPACELVDAAVAAVPIPACIAQDALVYLSHVVAAR